MGILSKTLHKNQIPRTRNFLKSRPGLSSRRRRHVIRTPCNQSGQSRCHGRCPRRTNHLLRKKRTRDPKKDIPPLYNTINSIQRIIRQMSFRTPLFPRRRFIRFCIPTTTALDTRTSKSYIPGTSIGSTIPTRNDARRPS